MEFKSDQKTSIRVQVIFVNDYSTNNDISMNLAAKGMFLWLNNLQILELDHNIGGLNCLDRSLGSLIAFLVSFTVTFFFSFSLYCFYSAVSGNRVVHISFDAVNLFRQVSPKLPKKTLCF